ncbi:MAG: hypothetical protein PHX21_10795 [bacterium]|nr:hypothetical protein [bacterium]
MKKSFSERLTSINRHHIYLAIALCIIIPFLTHKILPIKVSPPVKSAYETIDKLPAGSVVMISIDYEAGSQPELQPMLIALLHHLFQKNLKVIMVCHWPLGFPLGQDALIATAKKYDKKYGIDYVNLGYRPGVSSVMLGIGREIRTFFKSDYAGTSVDLLQLMKTVHNYNDIGVLIGLEAGATGDFWVRIANAQFGEKVILGCTAVSAPDCYPYLQAKQIEGLIGGLKGAAEYEDLVNLKGDAITGMTAQSVAHLAIIFFIIVGNVGYFLSIRRRKSN